ncbi:Tmemb_185A domain-containing protein/zf-C3HC4_3 domain-containing protein [Cephalotus follicularis]|uniref:Tmemb_185A domain-containing protein/zf-C3HC4_3 domain-containing protein n=1 Tax=Cephalotus follicularis TaxID=3775 RepID=A0A1Q3B178_CEPFO|nr:Tmemb_185A domain-containing protein/zf-C3HC4_3 domain-containing protein [Cephalotus follicularis]
MMSWRRVLKSVQALAAHGLLLSFTLLLLLKLDHFVSYSWWTIFFPLWLFHAVVARGRFSLPAPSVPHNRHWAPCHAVVSTPLLIAFELLLCIYMESIYVHGFAAVNLKIVFLPLLALEIIILIDNLRMCRALMPGDEESTKDEAIWETLPHFWVAISMIFFVAATIFTLLKLCGDIGALSWWDLFINFGIAECFAFLVCTKWSNPVIHRNSRTREASSSSTRIRYLDWNSGLVVSPEEDQQPDRMCGLQDIGGHIMKIPLIGFQALLCMLLEGTPPGARKIPLPLLFSPLFLVQGAGVLFAASRLVEKVVPLLRSGAGRGRYFRFSSIAHDFLGFLHHGSRLLGWWSIDEGSQEEQARLFHEGASGYNTFCGYPPEIVKKMPKKDLAEEVWRLQAALGEQTQITKFSQQEFERLQNEKVLCRVCFEGEISVVLLPCRHRTLCSTCSEKCKKCPICRLSIEERLPVYDV